MDIRGRKRTSDLKPQISAPLVPTSSEMLGVPDVVIENLVLKHLSAYPKSDVLELSNYLCVVTHIVENALAVLRKKSLIEVFQPNESLAINTLSHSHVRYSLSEKGLEEADLAFKRDAYLGPAPVSLDQYCEVVKAQDLRAQLVSRPDVEAALSDVYGVESKVPVLGPAINSGRALLLYGHAGTGKTFVASRIVNALQTSVFIPYAVYALGNIIKVFSAQHHKPIDNNGKDRSVSLLDQYDKRWLNCERPNIQVGGPMEYFFDHLSLPNGQQITIPFILTLAFSTNLDPQKISDPAFLRRLGYKIEFEPLLQKDYQTLWFDTAQAQGSELPENTIEQLYKLHRIHGVNYFPCLPKDLVGISKDIVLFEQLPLTITPEILTMAWKVYFTSDGLEEENNE
ncbi:AAA family ATPase [Vibrio fortis]